MNIIKTPKKSSNKSFKNTYVIHVEFEHGDADSVTHEQYVLKNTTDEQFLHFMHKFNELATAINDNRSRGKKLPDEILHKNGGVQIGMGMEIWLERDMFAREVSDYYAEMGISKILYYDDNHATYSVEVKK